MGLLHHVQAAYPDKPITLIVAFAPGGGTDLTGRVIGPFIEKYLSNNAKIIVLNKTGAGGAIGFAQLANSPPDGYTIGMINTSNVLTLPIERKADFHWQRYDLLGNLVDDPASFAVHTDSGGTGIYRRSTSWRQPRVSRRPAKGAALVTRSSAS